MYRFPEDQTVSERMGVWTRIVAECPTLTKQGSVRLTSNQKDLDFIDDSLGDSERIL
jgi:hypothetical protein